MASTTGKTDPVADQSNWRRKLAGRRIKLDDDRKALYCDRLRIHGVKTLAAKECDVSYVTVLGHIDNDPDFKEAVDEAVAEYAASVTTRIEKEALEGHEEKIESADGTVRTNKKLESGIRLAMLRRYDPEYKDRVEHSGGVGIGGVIVVPMRMSKEEWEAMYSPKDAPPELD